MNFRNGCFHDFIKEHGKRYPLYLLRWQGSTPLLSWCVVAFATFGATWATIIANFIGGLIFYWIDLLIFKYQRTEPMWYVKDNCICHDCGKSCRGYRLVRAMGYDKTNDPNPEWRCEECSSKKYKKYNFKK